MLKQLYIENYALIQQLDVRFDPGFSVITGETGAGKSIMLGALALILGQRADTQVLFDKEKKCVIEGVFDIKKLNLRSFFDAEGLDYDDHVILRREISPVGKSRAFINDTPVNLIQMKDLGDHLVDIHSQHQTLTLNDSDFQMNVVDALIEHPEHLEKYKESYKKYKTLSQEISTLKAHEQQLKDEQDYLSFLFTELEELKLQAGEQETMEQELEVMRHAEEIKGVLFQAANQLSEGEQNMLQSLSEIDHAFRKYQQISEELKNISERFHSAFVELKDLSSEVNEMADNVNFDAEKQQMYEERLDKIYRLQAKHHVQTIDELLQIQNDLSGKLVDITTSSEKIERLEQELQIVEKTLSELASVLSADRKKSSAHIEQEVTQVLKSLGMPEAHLHLQLAESDHFLSNGKDRIRFLFNANAGGEQKELGKVASGGELSRLMLAIKSVINSQSILPTIIFDEIDTGVSGDIAGKVSMLMQKMAENMQVIVITHLPQMAAKATYHYRVYKKNMDGVTRSEIKKLNNDEHLQAIAGMLSNEVVTDAAIHAAKELMK